LDSCCLNLQGEVTIHWSLPVFVVQVHKLVETALLDS
jgi:hypothetical protein